MIYPANWEKVTCHDWYNDEKKIWLCLENKNAICEIDKNSKNVKILGSFPHNGLGDADLSLSLIRCGDYIVFCPFKANDIAVLNICTGVLEFINLLEILEQNGHLCDGIEKFYRMALYKHYVFFFGIKYPAIMRLDLTTNRIDLFDEWMDQIEQNRCKDAVLFTDGYAQKEDEIYLPIGRCNGVLKINLNTMKGKYIEIKAITHGILGMTQRENHVWITEYDIGAEKFFHWNLDDDEIIPIDLPCHDAFYAPVYSDNSLLFFQNARNKSYRYDLLSGCWTDITSMLPDLVNSSDKIVRGDVVNYFANESKRFYHCDLKRNLVYFDELQINEKDFLNDSWEDYCRYYMQELKDHAVVENKLKLRDFIGIIRTIKNSKCC